MSREFCSLRWDVFFLFFLLSRTQLPDSLVPVALDRVPPFCFQCRSFVSLAQHHVRAHTHTNLFLKRKKNTKIGRIRRNPYWFDRWQPNDGRGRPRVHFISFLFFCRARRLQFIVLTKIRPEIGAQNLIELTGKTISIRVNATFELSKFVEKTRNDVIPKFSTFEGLAFICL